MTSINSNWACDGISNVSVGIFWTRCRLWGDLWWKNFLNQLKRMSKSDRVTSQRLPGCSKHTDSDWLMELGLFTLENRKLTESSVRKLPAAYNCLKGNCKETLKWRLYNRGQQQVLSWITQIGHFFHSVTQKNGGISILECFQDLARQSHS